jgi:hypothetical protein
LIRALGRDGLQELELRLWYISQVIAGGRLRAAGDGEAVAGERSSAAFGRCSRTGGNAKSRMYRRSEFPRMLDKERRSLAQDQVDVRLVQQHGHLNEPVEGSDLQFLLLPAAKRWGRLNTEDCPASTPNQTAKLVFCLCQAGHV